MQPSNTIKRKLMLALAILVMAMTIHLEMSATTPYKVEVKGSGKKAMILIPGLTCPGDVWQQTVDRYKDKYTCHVFTLPGFAGQPPIQTDEYLKMMRDQIIKYIRNNNLYQPVLAGHSLGGFISLWIAAVVPDLVSQVIVVDALPFLPAIQNPLATPESMKPVAENMRKMMANASSDQVKESQKYFLSSMSNSAETQAIIGQWGLDSHQATVAQAMYELQTIDLRDEIASVKASMLVMGAWVAYKNYGVTHESTFKNFSAQYEKVTNVIIQLTDVGRHFIMYDDPDWYFNQIDDFLKI